MLYTLYPSFYFESLKVTAISAPCSWFSSRQFYLFWMHWPIFLLWSTCICGNLWLLIYGSILPLLRRTLPCLSSRNRRQILLCLPNLTSNSPLIIFSRDGYGHEVQCFHLVEVPRFLGEQDGHCVFCPDIGPWHVHKTISVPKQGKKESWGPSLLHVMTYSYAILQAYIKLIHFLQPT